MKRLIIIGASGHGRVVADVAVLNGYTDIYFLDDEKTGAWSGFSIIGKSFDAPEGELFVAIGNTSTRKRLIEYYRDRSMPVLIHPNATVAEDVEIGAGTVVMAGAVINPGARVGSGCIINTCSSVDHDCVISDYVHIAVGAHLCGTVNIGQETLIGAGATVINNINIGEGCLIGAGAVVVNDISAKCTAVGCPAKPIKFFD